MFVAGFSAGIVATLLTGFAVVVVFEWMDRGRL